MTSKTKKKPLETQPTVQAEPSAPVKKKPARSKSAAATHKTTTRTKSVTVAAPPFDASAHHDEIARVAYFLWLDRGAHHGHEHEDWLRAVEIVKARPSNL